MLHEAPRPQLEIGPEPFRKRIELQLLDQALHMSAPAIKTPQPIAGYMLGEKIGAGGFGEVWKAEAPGGLRKAVKIIRGHIEGLEAACELQSLNRIKEVRHPFLLSLDRIEIIDGQVVIVSELADESLRDCFTRYRAAGEPGIPRDELLVYLHDAAEALDYISEHFSLQHLDIKPENLLIVGGRVKVADFGLVQDIEAPKREARQAAHSRHEMAQGDSRPTSVSVLEGLTPAYASPEVFCGQPSALSDQYSLAIVYQEMLTGILPFPGRTPEQLAAQHCHSRPRLTPLPSADRPAIGKALSKIASQRYSSCLGLLEALVGDRPSGTRPTAAPTPGANNSVETLCSAQKGTDLVRRRKQIALRRNNG
ncbi:MAG: serine/threonine-protein kinase [Planctomycetota bacterium]